MPIETVRGFVLEGEITEVILDDDTTFRMVGGEEEHGAYQITIVMNGQRLMFPAPRLLGRQLAKEPLPLTVMIAVHLGGIEEEDHEIQ